MYIKLFPLRKACLFFMLLGSIAFANAQISKPGITTTTAGKGWSGNSINTVIFRKNAITSMQDFQVLAYYDAEGYVMLASRKLNDSSWQIKRTKYKGNIRDAHNSISIALDGRGYLHMAWDHHNTRLRYCRSIAPFSLEMGDEQSMIGSQEKSVSYPEFFSFSNGNLLFLYRDGGSGNGNLVLNRFDANTATWQRIQDNLIDGEGKRNAYWQAFVDDADKIHLSWVWRESPDVASNHDMHYAVSGDGGQSWQNSLGKKYMLPINMHTAELVKAIPEKSELINQTSMYADKKGTPYIVSYWRGAGNVPQFHVLYKKGKKWKHEDAAFRQTNFSLSGGGTKQIPISRPQIMVAENGRKQVMYLLFRDAERNDKVTLAAAPLRKHLRWKIVDVSDETVGSWEPNYDIELWKKTGRLDILVQQVWQADAEGIRNASSTPVQVFSIYDIGKFK